MKMWACVQAGNALAAATRNGSINFQVPSQRGAFDRRWRLDFLGLTKHQTSVSAPWPGCKKLIASIPSYMCSHRLLLYRHDITKRQQISLWRRSYSDLARYKATWTLWDRRILGYGRDSHEGSVLTVHQCIDLFSRHLTKFSAKMGQLDLEC